MISFNSFIFLFFSFFIFNNYGEEFINVQSVSTPLFSYGLEIELPLKKTLPLIDAPKTKEEIDRLFKRGENWKKEVFEKYKNTLQSKFFHFIMTEYQSEWWEVRKFYKQHPQITWEEVPSDLKITWLKFSTYEPQRYKEEIQTSINTIYPRRQIEICPQLPSLNLFGKNISTKDKILFNLQDVMEDQFDFVSPLDFFSLNMVELKFNTRNINILNLSPIKFVQSFKTLMENLCIFPITPSNWDNITISQHLHVVKVFDRNSHLKLKKNIARNLIEFLRITNMFFEFDYFLKNGKFFEEKSMIGESLWSLGPLSKKNLLLYSSYLNHFFSDSPLQSFPLEKNDRSFFAFRNDKTYHLGENETALGLEIRNINFNLLPFFEKIINLYQSLFKGNDLKLGGTLDYYNASSEEIVEKNHLKSSMIKVFNQIPALKIIFYDFKNDHFFIKAFSQEQLMILVQDQYRIQKRTIGQFSQNKEEINQIVQKFLKQHTIIDTLKAFLLQTPLS